MARNQFGGFGGANMQQLMKQAKKMQQQLEDAQASLQEKEYEASAGGGTVTCRVNGKNEVISLTINPEAVDPEDVEMLQDLVMAAVNEAFRQVEEETQSSMSRLTGGLGGLGGFGF